MSEFTLFPVPTGSLAPMQVVPQKIAGATINVASGEQYPNTGIITPPVVIPRNFIILVVNNTDATISSIAGVLQSEIGTVSEFSQPLYPSTIGSGGGTGIAYILEGRSPNLFLQGAGLPTANGIQLNFNLSAATSAAGTISWLLYGY
jgi:hypothetical protein